MECFLILRKFPQIVLVFSNKPANCPTLGGGPVPLFELAKVKKKKKKKKKGGTVPHFLEISVMGNFTV